MAQPENDARTARGRPRGVRNRPHDPARSEVRATAGTTPDAAGLPGTAPGRGWRIPPGNGTLARARELTRDTLQEWDHRGEDYAHAVLLVSELVTNAHRHAGGPADLELHPVPGGVLLRVSDASSRLPVRREPGADGGFGMHLLARLSESWGVEPFPGGKSVWARLAPRPDA
ncbi:anti-sigma regulatory factor (Ser/Thr protein kinase) [Kitasatospora herbaricolor]|uniref:ATP-binding protein n=1 Tax=Kitasatospora herbaricolor TaxID=68217 RepID=UPI001749014A|nr:ATP-binding protein [Kitasatospora herbaricolor]MDQ0312328.1 anti-sigma regulatory factor (Ser/Thr protein kinase) [Kitasatospora herbaricolor]